MFDKVNSGILFLAARVGMPILASNCLIHDDKRTDAAMKSIVDDVKPQVSVIFSMHKY